MLERIGPLRAPQTMCGRWGNLPPSGHRLAYSANHASQTNRFVPAV